MPLPTQSMLIPNVQRDLDVRGGILSIVDEPVRNVSIITCNAGSIRSNHYHKTDWHFMYVLEGEINYFFKAMNNDKVGFLRVKVGDNIFTPPMELHATQFPVKTVLIVSSRNPRDQETYERDTVRQHFVDENNLQEMLREYS